MIYKLSFLKSFWHLIDKKGVLGKESKLMFLFDFGFSVP